MSIKQKKIIATALISMFAMITILILLVTPFQGIKATDTNADIEFAVIYSNAMDEGFEIIRYDTRGNILNEKKFKEGQAIYHFSEFENNYYLMSERKNRHYILSQDGEVNLLFGPEKYEKDRNIGSAFSRSSEKHMFFSMNVGINPEYSPDEYLSELVYFDGSKNSNIELLGYIQSVVEENNKAYALFFNGNNNKLGIYVIDLLDNKLIKTIPIDNHLNQFEGYFPAGQNNGSSLQIYQDKLILILDGNTKETQYKPIMQIINPSSGELEQEISISQQNFDVFDTQIFNNKLYVISTNSSFIEFNGSEFKRKMIKLNQDEQFIKQRKSDRGNISGIKIIGNQIYILYDFVKGIPSERTREIREYNLETGEEGIIIPLSYRSDKEIIKFFNVY
ncbi:hypothetical protein [Paenibacillus sp. 2KB_22]|uniref:hypothetical protein n=1 Tax=Paenibacillus sp. 2KB_22 TaxID=3232978 RepID=UPI003F9485F1